MVTMCPTGTDLGAQQKGLHMINPNIDETHPMMHNGTCPSCAQVTGFDFLGVQQWPERVAQLAGIPAKQTVWQCQKCLTTLMEASIINKID